MSSPLAVRLAAAVVRVWARAYTWRLPVALRDARRDEIESDLWESQHDPDRAIRASLPLRLLVRTVFGIPDDLGWRMEQGMTRDDLRRRWRLGITIGAGGALALWVVLASSGPGLPELPTGPRFPFRAGWQNPPPPPPPPPPPCLPPAVAKGPQTDCTR